MMTDGTTGPVVLINSFKVATEDQPRLIALLSQVTQESVALAPGFLSAALHRSFDGNRVIMYARWRSAADYAAMRQSGASKETLEAIGKIAAFEPGMFEIVREFRPSGE